MNFTPEYFKGEVRDGFYVQPLMKRAWAAQLEVLEEIDKICAKHNIPYIACYGTLLGAIRHKGFIPWDDDLDIAMLREDYERFSHYAKQEIPKDWRFYDCNNYNTLLIRINNGFGSRLDQEFLERFHGCPFSVGIDIFPIDHIPDNEEEEKRVLFIISALNVVGINIEQLSISPPDALESLLQDLEEITGQHLDRTKSLQRQLFHLADRASSMYWNTKTEYAAIITGLDKNSKDRIPLSCFNHIIRVPFENTTIPIIADYELMLKNYFGENFMEPVICTPHEYPFFLEPLDKLKAFLTEHNITIPNAFHIYARKGGKPLVSVIIPCHNVETHIDNCLAKLMCQTVSVTSFEILCIDNASTDSTFDKLKVWEKKLDNIVVIIQCNCICTREEAINIGMEYASAEQMIILDAKDYVEINYIESLLQTSNGKLLN